MENGNVYVIISTICDNNVNKYFVFLQYRQHTLLFIKEVILSNERLSKSIQLTKIRRTNYVAITYFNNNDTFNE